MTERVIHTNVLVILDVLPDWILTSYERGVLTGMVRHKQYGNYELGVVKTPFGEVAMGRVITGICAGIDRNKNMSFYFSSEHMDNLYAATVAGDLGLLTLWNPYPPYYLSPSSGYWYPNTQCPKNFSLYSTPSYNTSLAKIRGTIDGFLLGYKLSEWNKAEIRLGQLLRMYYHHGIVYDTQLAACRRIDTFQRLANDSLVNQTVLAAYATKLVWSNYWDYYHVSTYYIQQYAERST